MRKAILAILAVAALTACSTGKRPLHDMRSTTGGPDEFSVMPVAPLEIPETMDLFADQRRESVFQSIHHRV